MKYENEMALYEKLNQNAEKGAIVLFGGTTDKSIPSNELLNAFGIEENFYNRSFSELSVKDAITLYDKCIKELKPSSIIIHIGEDETELLDFSSNLSNLISYIRKDNKKCKITVVSLKNNILSIVNELNTAIKNVADSVRCEFENISTGKVWNPENSKQVKSFISSMGLRHKTQNRDVIHSLYCV